MASTFEVTETRIMTIKQGWGVHVTPIWAGEEEPERISDIAISIVEIRPENIVSVAGVPCVQAADQNVPVQNFRDVPDLGQDDTHDLRTRWFEDEASALNHAKAVQHTWDNPPMWVSFVELDR